MKSCNNMGEILQLCGSGQYTSDMVINADMVLSLQEDIDYHWWIRYEYRFKGKNHVGLMTHANKMTSNTFYPGDEKTESTEDWDKRYFSMFPANLRILTVKLTIIIGRICFMCQCNMIDMKYGVYIY